jgi:AAA15 family ATPase/GTPase
MKLSGFSIKNYSCFDEKGCEIKIDNIVILIGQNNTGKSSILDAYETFATVKSKLPLAAFRNEDVAIPVEMVGIFTDLTDEDIDTIGGEKWVHVDAKYGRCVKAMYKWSEPDTEGEKYSFLPESDAFVKGGLGGWDTLIASRIPSPLRIKPTDTPTKTEAAVIEILTSSIKDAVKGDKTKINQISQKLEEVLVQYSNEMSADIEEATSSITNKLAQIFPDYSVEFKAGVGKIEADKLLAGGSHIRIKDSKEKALPLQQQGAGMQRSFLWSAISALAESNKVKGKKKAVDKPRILLIDEPESFLHPSIVRAAREALYALAELNNWQVMATTHSPVFIDVSKPHTTIIRVERDDKWSTKTISTDKISFDTEEVKRLAMIRACNPFVNEFFFADKVILVEGETEQAAFNLLLQREEEFKHRFHIVSCFGKANIPMFCKILNQFGIDYIAVHDSDSPCVQRTPHWIRNSMWTINERIYEEVAKASPGKGVCVVHVPDFEGYYFNEIVTSDKPNHTLSIITSEDFSTKPEFEPLRTFFTSLNDSSHHGIYKSMEELGGRVAKWVEDHKPTPAEMWRVPTYDKVIKA